jgi:multicopper oxidase
MMSPGDTDYPLYLINGRVPEDPETIRVRRGDTVRLRLVNASAQKIFRFSVGGHRLTVTHTDGNPVEPTETAALKVGMGERYDVLLRADDPGVWQVAAAPEGGGAPARAVLRYKGVEGLRPPEDHVPAETLREFPSYEDLHAEGLESFPAGGLFSGPDRVFRLSLSGGMGDYEWTIGGQRYPDAEPLVVERGEWVRVEMENRSMMVHPMHLHGHTFQVLTGSGRGPFKDTVLVEPHMGRLAFDFVADNPGEWFFHCHNAYHMEAGMARVFSY